MIKYSIIFLLLSSVLLFGQNDEQIMELRIPFAEIKGENFEFITDTLDYKRSISDNLFSKDSKTTYDKIEIRKSKTIGDFSEEYYYVLLYHHEKELLTARFLKRHSDTLYLIVDNSFGSMYLSCIGIDQKCSPNIVVDEKRTMKWICSDKVGVCTLDEKECKSAKSIILE